MKKSILLALALLGAVAAPSFAQDSLLAPKVAPKLAATYSDEELRALGEGIAFPYEKLERALIPYVNKDGAVAYAKLKGNNDLETFVRAVAIADRDKFPKWMNPADPKDPKSVATPDRTPELTFLINAYNGLFFKTLADAYPINTPGQIKGLYTAKTHRLAGKDVSFDDLRREIAALDPRALFALPDGTNNGPRATSAAYTYFGLSNQLDRAAQAFVNDQSRVQAPIRLQNTVEVSPWLAGINEFFAPKGGRVKNKGIQNVLTRFTSRDSDQRYFATGDYQVRFALGDASINEQTTR